MPRQSGIISQGTQEMPNSATGAKTRRKRKLEKEPQDVKEASVKKSSTRAIKETVKVSIKYKISKDARIKDQNQGVEIPKVQPDSPAKKLAQKKTQNVRKARSRCSEQGKRLIKSENDKESHYFSENDKRTEKDKSRKKKSPGTNSDGSSALEHTIPTKRPKAMGKKVEISLISDTDSDSDFEEVSFIGPSPKTTPEREHKKSSKQPAKSRKSSSNRVPGNQRLKKGQSKHVQEEDIADGPVAIESVRASQLFANADASNIKDMLLAFEKTSAALKKNAMQHAESSQGKEMDEGSDSDSEWEEVEAGEAEESPQKKEPAGPQGTVEITLEGPNIMRKKRKKKGFDLEDWFRLQVNRYKKETQIELHKVHLLCLLSHGCHRNKLCRTPTLMAVALSLVPIEMVAVKPDAWDLLALNKLMKWFNETFQIDADLKENPKLDEERLLQRLGTQRVASELELVMIYVLTMRSLGLDARLVYSLQPVTHKASDLKTKKKIEKNSEENGEEFYQASETNKKDTDNKKVKSTEKGSSKLPENSSTKCPSVKDKDITSNNHRSQPKKQGSNQSKDKKAASKLCPVTSQANEHGRKSSSKNKAADQNKKTSETSASSPMKQGKTKNTRPRMCASKVNYDERKTEEVELSSGEEYEEEEEEEIKEEKKSRGGRSRRGKAEDKKSSTKKDRHKKYTNTKPRSDEEFEREDVTYRSPSLGSRSGAEYKLKAKGSRVKVVSSDSDDSIEVIKANIKNKGRDYWSEVYLQAKQKWICVDCVRGRVNHPSEMEDQATQPLYYVLGYDASGSVKDLTRKYAKNWMAHTRKLRVDEEWWQIALLPHRPMDAERDSTEDLEIQAHLLKKPLPTTISEYKNHPLYALRRHLLKFEAIYPDTAVPLGYIRKEPVYARECVHTLHSRQNWLKEARLVRVKEEPYKLVKARMTKKRAALMDGQEEPTLELFGFWQTEVYIPPPAYNGKVPRNEYGNVELFKPCMLPGGTVHLQGMPGLNRVAKKLSIDCVAAMTGWDSHGGYSHPVLDGWVVCEEHKDTLLAAWDEEQEIIREREEERREKRVLGNWKLLVKGIIIKERLKQRYDLKDPEEEFKEAEKKGKKAGPTKAQSEKATDAEVSWPRNLQQKTKSSNKKKTEQGNLFPFEVEEL